MRLLTPKTILLSTFLASSLYASGNYTATIYSHAECAPKAENDRPSGGMKENRRVDVTMETTVLEKHQVAEKTQIKTRAYLKDGGVIWTTSDPLVAESRLEIKSDTLHLDRDGLSIKPLKFFTYNNYSDYIKRYELLIVNADDPNHLVPLKLIEGEGLPSEITWDPNKDELIALHPKQALRYSLRVYDENGHYDETEVKKLFIQEGVKDSYFKDIEGEIFGKSSIKTRTIPIEGSRVRVYGSDISPDNLLKIADQEIRVDKSGKFVFEKIKKAGHYDIPVSIMTHEGDLYERELALDVKANHIFLVGLADFTAGAHHVSGNIKPLEADEHYNEDIFVDGRLAFYLKGKVKGKYLITAQMDTQEADIKDMFKNIQKKDPRSMFRNLDPDQYYYVYGDDSHAYRDTDSQGKLYLRAEWDKSKALWGNFNTGVTGNEFANINRSLYGAKVQHSSMGVTKYGDNKTDLIVFGSEAQSAYAHNEFEGTGGSLYYLKHKEILQGSEKVWVEVQERNSQRVADKIELIRGQDYEIDEIQGRIILTRPLSPYGKMSGPSIIKDNPLDGNRVMLKVDYEYLPDEFQANQATYGARGKQWIGDFLAIGATYGHEGRSSGDYEVKGVDVTLRGGKNTYVKAEFANSSSLQSNGANYRSMDGGLSFNSVEVANAETSGDAYGVEAKVALSDFKTVKNDSSAALWYKKRESGFSNARLGSSDEVTDYGAEATAYLTDYLKVTGRSSVLEAQNNKDTISSIEADATMGDFVVGAEARYVENEVDAILRGKGTLAGLKVRYKINSYFDIYAMAQTTLDAQGTYRDNDLYTLGTNVNVGRLTLTAEASTGDRGNAMLLGADYGISEDYSIYSNYILSTDAIEGKRNIFTVGQRSKVTDALSVFSEHQFSHSDEMAGVGNSFGIDYAFTKYLLANVTYNKVNYDDANQRDRDALSASLHYGDRDITASTKLEYRKDKGTNLEETQYLTTNRLSYKVNPSWRMMAKLNYAKTVDERDDSKEATFTEAGVGFAYRPVEHTRFNLIGKYTYLYDLSTLDQIASTPDERSHIVSAEMSYQLSPKWSLGSKLGLKMYGIREDRDSGEWYESELSLAALRVNYHIIKSWDAMVEGHMLVSKDDGVKKGILLGLYKHIGEHVKMGIGYNFSDFSDDLTQGLDYQAGGWFVNVIGKY
jgi:hypothetical protein